MRAELRVVRAEVVSLRAPVLEQGQGGQQRESTLAAKSTEEETKTKNEIMKYLAISHSTTLPYPTLPWLQTEETAKF